MINSPPSLLPDVDPPEGLPSSRRRMFVSTVPMSPFSTQTTGPGSLGTLLLLASRTHQQHSSRNYVEHRGHKTVTVPSFTAAPGVATPWDGLVYAFGTDITGIRELASTRVFIPIDQYELTTALQRHSLALYLGPQHLVCAYYRH
jgi:hypothetical protein